MLDLPDPSANPCASNDYNTDPSNPCPELTQSSQPTEQPPATSTQFLSCIATSANELLFNHGASATVFEFDYELHTPLQQQSGDSSSSSVDSAISEFQNGLAGSIAADYGVYCNHFNDGKKKRRSNRELGKVVWEDDGWNNVNDDGEEEKYTTEWNGDVYGVSSSPSDVVDDFVTKCTIERNLQVPTTCTPIKGYLTLYSTPTANNHNRRDLSSHPSNSNTILNTIQTYIEKRTHLYTSETILAVSYIGIRSSVGVGLLNPNLLMRPEERKRSSSSSGGDNRRSLVPSVVGLSHDDVLDYIMGLSVGGVAVGCLLMVLLAFRRVNRRHVAARQNLEVVV